MKDREIKAIAMSRGIAAGAMYKAELIRTIQRHEGYQDCFGSRERAKKCGQMHCLWRKDCLEM